MKKLSKKLVIGIAGAAAVLAAAVLVGIFLLRVDAGKAQSIALEKSGGGQIISQEVESEGLWNEYKYEIVNGSSWYEIEIGGFGQVKELEVKTSR